MIFQSLGENKSKLIEFIKKENLSKETVLHQAIAQGHENLVEMLLTLFKTDSKKLTECFMKEDAFKNTCFHLAAKNGNVKIVNLLMNAFPGDKNKIMEQIMKKKCTLKYGTSHCFRRRKCRNCSNIYNIIQRQAKTFDAVHFRGK